MRILPRSAAAFAARSWRAGNTRRLLPSPCPARVSIAPFVVMAECVPRRSAAPRCCTTGRARRDELHSGGANRRPAAGRRPDTRPILRGVERRAVGDQRRNVQVSLVCFISTETAMSLAIPRQRHRRDRPARPLGELTDDPRRAVRRAYGLHPTVLLTRRGPDHVRSCRATRDQIARKIGNARPANRGKPLQIERLSAFCGGGGGSGRVRFPAAGRGWRSAGPRLRLPTAALQPVSIVVASGLGDVADEGGRQRVQGMPAWGLGSSGGVGLVCFLPPASGTRATSPRTCAPRPAVASCGRRRTGAGRPRRRVDPVGLRLHRP